MGGAGQLWTKPASEPYVHSSTGSCPPPPPPPPGPPQVRATMGKFEERLWSIVRNFLRVAKEDPELLVTALQVCMPVLWLCTCDCLYSKTETQRAGAA